MEKDHNEERIKIEDLECFNWANFSKRNFCIDNNKNALDILEKTPSEYLLVDLCELRFPNCLVTNTKGDRWFCTQTLFFNEFMANQEVLKNCNIQTIQRDIIRDEEQLYKVLDDFTDFIKGLFPTNKVIVVINLPALQYLDDEKKNIFDFPQNNYFCKNIFIQYYNYFISKLSGASIIKPPANSIGWAQHLWGKGNLHFINEYYEYLYKAILVVTGGGGLAKLKQLEEEYYNIIANIINKKRIQYFIDKNTTNLLQDENFSDYKVWKLAKSQGAIYSEIEKKLEIGKEEKDPYCILSQAVELDAYLGKELTLSLKYKTNDNTSLYLVLRKMEIKDDKKIFDYTYLKTLNSLGEILISSLTFEVKEDIVNAEKLEVMVYVNKPNSTAFLYKIKLELGKNSSIL